MSEGNSLINFGDVSKPATVLIEKISAAIGRVYEPTHIRRIAKAESDALITKANTESQITDIRSRAIERMIHEETIRQENIEAITSQAIHQLSPDATPQHIDNDWIAYFFENCRHISNTEIQTLWSNILAGEANTPGTYSKRTLSLISTLDRSDAELFTSICSFALIADLDDPHHVPLVFDFEDEIFKKSGINFYNLTHLESIGLLKFNFQEGFVIHTDNNQYDFFLESKKITLTASPSAEGNIDVGTVLLTATGLQLAPICGAQPNPQLLEYITMKYKNKNVGIEISNIQAD